MAEEKFHSGFVALVGRPNVGKSTLMNAVLGEKVSIVSAHAQTTRNKITGVWNGKNSQVVFLDTPGMHKPQSKLGQVIRQSTVDALDEVDIIVFICACDDPLGAGDRYILSLLKDKKVPVVLVLSKIDLIIKENRTVQQNTPVFGNHSAFRPKRREFERIYDGSGKIPA